MTEHQMSLNEGAFCRMKSCNKTIEIRLFDEKRKKVKVGDTIIFSNLADQSTLKAKVTDILRFSSFEELVNSLPMTQFGWPEDHDKYEYLQAIYKIYTKEDEKKYGVIGININVLE